MDLTQATPTEPALSSLWPVKAMFRVLIHPADTFRRLPERRTFLIPVLIQIFLILFYLQINPITALSVRQNAGTFYVYIFAALLAWIIMTTGPALAYYFAGLLVFPGKSRFGHWFDVMVFATLPNILFLLCYVIYLNVSPPAQVTAFAMLKQHHLNDFLSPAAFVPVSIRWSWFGQFLAQINPFALYSLALAAIGYSVRGGVTPRKTSAVVVGVWLVFSALGAIFFK